MSNSPLTDDLSIEEQIEKLISRDLPRSIEALGPLQAWELPALRRYAAQLSPSPSWRAKLQKEIVTHLRYCMRSAINLHRPPLD